MVSISKTLKLSIGLVFSLTAAAVAGGPGQQGAITAVGGTGYLGLQDSLLFDAGCDRPGIEFYLENFEDGVLNTPGVVIPPVLREILSPGANTDSVDTNGRSMRASNASLGSVTLSFSAVTLGALPEKVGFVLTDTNGAANADFTIVVTDGDGNFANFTFSNIGDGTAAATQDDDVFIGFTSPFGIEQIQISSPSPLWELDHLQYSRLATPALQTRGDGDASGTGDIYFHVPGGNVTAWYMNDLVEDPEVITSVLSSAWTLQGMGDLDGDCDDDLIWRNNASPSKVQVWMMQNGQPIQKTNITTTLGVSWQITAIADFNGDGKADLFQEQDSGKKMRIWFMDGNSIASSATVTTAGFDPSLYTVCSSGDINGDGKADIVWRKTSNGDLRYFRMNGATVVQNGLIQGGLSTSWIAMGGGDLDGDGDLDLGFRTSANTGVLLMTLNSAFGIQGSAQLTLASGFTFVGFPDVNGDGNADLIWRKTTTGAIVRWKMNGLQVISSATVGTGPTGTAKAYAEK